MYSIDKYKADAEAAEQERKRVERIARVRRAQAYADALPVGGAVKMAIIDQDGEWGVRYEFETFEEVEEAFMAMCWGRKDLKSKVIGKALIMWQLKEE